MNSSDSGNSGRRPPRWLIVVSLVVVVAAVVARIFHSTFHDWTRVDPAYSILGSTALVGLVLTIWWLWFVVRSGASRGLRWSVGGLGLLGPGLFFAFFSPIFDGEINLIGFEPRWWPPQKQLALQTTGAAAKSPGTDSLGDSQTGAELGAGNSAQVKTAAANFPEFLGPGRKGAVTGVSLDPDWQARPPRVVWKQDIGEGWSGFTAVDGRAYTLEQRGDKECVTCYEIATGQLRWIYENPQRYEDTPGIGRVGPRSTPTLDSGRVFAQGAAGKLMCLDASTGQNIWTVDLCELLQIPQVMSTNSRGLAYSEEASTLAWGRAASPLIVDNLVITTGGGPKDGPKATLLAFDKTTGDLVWRGGEEMIAYGSPALAVIAGIPQVTLTAESASLGFDPKTGKQLWRVERPGNSNMDANCSQVTWVSDNHLLLTKGYHLGGQLISLDYTEQGWEVKTVWENRRVLTTKFSNPVIYDGHAYAISDGFLECVNLSEQKLKWKQRGKFGHGQLLLVGQHLLVHSEFGKLNLVAAEPDGYRLLGEIPTVRGLCWNTLCFYDRFVLLRSQQEAACIELPIQETPTLGAIR